VRRPKTNPDVEIKALQQLKSKKDEEKNRTERMKDKVKKTAGKKKTTASRAEDVSIEGRGMEKYI